MKIALLANDTTYTYNLRKALILRLQELGHSVVIISEILQFKEELNDLGCELVDLSVGRHGKNPLNDIILLTNYIRCLKKVTPDIVLSYNIKPDIYGGIACKLLKIPFYPNITGLGTAVEYPGALQKLTTKLYKLGVSSAECIFFQNEDNQNFFIDNNMISKNTRLRLLPGSGVDLRVNTYLEYPENDGIINFLFVARILKEKGIDIYLDAARKLHSEKVIFHICGMCDDNRYLSILEEEERNGVIIYHGEQKRMTPFFQQADCILHPSYYPEGMSNVLLEAAASGRPVITTNRGGCREIVDNNISGYIVPIKDEEAFIKAVERFLNLSWEDRKQMGINGRKKVENNFDRELVADAYVEEITMKE